MEHNNNDLLKEKAIVHKDNSLNRLDVSFLKHINSQEYKTSHLLAFWINDYANYHDEEKNFETGKLIVFKRGNIIKANLGFNIGHELGGLHYCIVLDKYTDIWSLPAEQVKQFTTDFEYVKKIKEEISKMKIGSIALINQITTISKQRIFDDEILRKVRLSPNSLDMIDASIIKFFTK